MPRVLVHAGYHKTGTSSLQDTLRRNRDGLTQHFLFYGQEDFQDAGAYARIYAQRPFAWHKRRFRAAFRSFLNTIPDGHDIVLSRETFAGGIPGHRDWRGRPLQGYYATSRVLLPLIRDEVLRRFPLADLAFLFTTRDRDSWVTSIHGHLLRSIKLTHDLCEFQTTMAKLPAPEDEVRKIAPHLQPHSILTAKLEDHKDRRLGLARVVLDHFNVPDATRHRLSAAKRAYQGQPAALRQAFLELNRSNLQGEELKDAKEALLRA